MAIVDPVFVTGTEAGRQMAPDEPVLGILAGGQLTGNRLEQVVARLAFWFAWSSFYPNTDVFV